MTSSNLKGDNFSKYLQLLFRVTAFSKNHSISIWNSHHLQLFDSFRCSCAICFLAFLLSSKIWTSFPLWCAVSIPNGRHFHGIESIQRFSGTLTSPIATINLFDRRSSPWFLVIPIKHPHLMRRHSGWTHLSLLDLTPTTIPWIVPFHTKSHSTRMALKSQSNSYGSQISIQLVNASPNLPCTASMLIDLQISLQRASNFPS